MDFWAIFGQFWSSWLFIRPISGILGINLGRVRPISVIRELAGLFWGLGLNSSLLYAYFG